MLRKLNDHSGIILGKLLDSTNTWIIARARYRQSIDIYRRALHPALLREERVREAEAHLKEIKLDQILSGANRLGVCEWEGV